MFAAFSGRRARQGGLVLAILGAGTSITGAVGFWIATYYACTTGGCGPAHYFEWSLGIWMILGAAALLVGCANVRRLGTPAGAWFVLSVTVTTALLFAYGFISIGGHSVLNPPSLLEPLAYLYAGYALEVVGTVLVAEAEARYFRRPSRRPTGV